MFDFTLTTYKNLLQTLLTEGYTFQTLRQYQEQPQDTRTIILRHDVDRLPQNALQMAKLENDLGIQSSYYFRSEPFVFKPDIIKQIAELGHEIGYHYEDLSLTNGYIDKAYESFRKNLEAFRKIYPVKTICMHGSPRSKWDSREIWKNRQRAGQEYDYKKLGIIGEPYFDVDYSKVLYITDTGRKWNNAAVSVRDRVGIRGQRPKVGNQAGRRNLQEFYRFRNTQDIIKAIENNELPNQIMFNIHPHRWHDNFVGWTKELVMQNLKNGVKRIIVKYKK